MVHSGTVYRVGLNLGPATLHMARGGHGIAMLKSLMGSIRWKSTDRNLCKTQIRRIVKDFYSGQLLRGFTRCTLSKLVGEIWGEYDGMHIKQTCVKQI